MAEIDHDAAIELIRKGANAAEKSKSQHSSEQWVLALRYVADMADRVKRMEEANTRKLEDFAAGKPVKMP